MNTDKAAVKYGRREAGYRKVEERLKDFRPVSLRATDAEVRIQAARCMECGTPFCHGCGCPLANVIPEINDMVGRGRWEQAYALLSTTSSFPEFTARLCPALCEGSCVLGLHEDPVTVREIELAVVEKAFEKGYARARPPAVRLEGRVAVIGSGPAGLAVADAVNRAGYRVTVFDRARQAGGILRYGIPDFKLEKSVLERRLALLLGEGVEFELGVAAGEDVSAAYLRDRFGVICLAGGSRQPRDLRVPGRELAGIHFAMEYLVQQNLRVAGEIIPPEKDISAEGRDVAVIGGGDTGSDCLGTALRQGAKSVRLLEILPEPPAERSEHTPWPMWPDMLRESSSHKEGGERRWCVSTKEFLGRDGRVTGLRCAEVVWSRGADGKLAMREKPGAGFELPADLVLLSLGFGGAGPSRLADELGVERDVRGGIKADANHMTNVRGVFAAGDMQLGQSLVVRAIADGREAARGIIAFLAAAGPA